MEYLRHLLHLPFELRDMIWASSAATGDVNGLMRCCRQTRDEFSRYCNLLDDITKLVKLRIWVDSTYIRGSWLKFEYSWEAKGHTYRAIETVCDLDDPIAQRLLEMTHAEEIVIHLQAPRRGHFVGALLMMLAKTDDVYHLISNISKSANPTGPSNITIRFATEAIQPGQSEKETKNFWECRSTKVLQESIRNHILHDNYTMPCFYEYFLINHPVTFASPPKIEFCSWPRISAHIQSTKKRRPKDVEFMVREIGQKESLKYLDKFRHLRDELAAYSAKMMVDRRNRDDANAQSRRYWEANDYGAANLKYRFQFLLDSLVGPVGGCLDMLRLHRFRTMGASEANFFARDEQTALKKFASLAGAASEINNRLKILFNPFASKDTRKLRTRCPHLSAVPWATDPSAEESPRQYCPRSEWLKNYPNGIRYSWNGGNLAEWRFQWATSECEARDPDIVWLNKWWDCLSCCPDSSCALGTLSLRFEKKISSNWDKFFHKSPHNGGDRWHCLCHWDCQYLYRPVMVRRQCIRKVEKPNRRLEIGGLRYHCLAEECREWTRTANEDATFWRPCCCDPCPRPPSPRRTCCGG